MIYFFAFTILGFIGLEVFSYAAHRWLFHGVLWRIHKTHHVSKTGIFETNDYFILIFASITVLLLVFSEKSLHSIALPIGLGIAIYGVLYFIAHDLFTHRRFFPFGSKNRVLSAIRFAHQRHHQIVTKKGVEPFGLFVFHYRRLGSGKKVKSGNLGAD